MINLNTNSDIISGGLYGVLLSNTNATLLNNYQLFGTAFICATSQSNIKVKDLSGTYKTHFAIDNSSKLFYNNLPIPSAKIGLNSFYNFPDCFPQTLQDNPSTDLPAATGGSIIKITDCWKTMEKIPSLSVSSPLLNDGQKFYFGNLQKLGFFTEDVKLSLNNDETDKNNVITKNAFNRLPKNLNGFNLDLTFGKDNNLVYNLNNNSLELPSYFNGKVNLINSITNGILYINNLKYIEFTSGTLNKSVTLSATNIDKVYIHDNVQYFNKIKAKNTNFYIISNNKSTDIDDNFFNVLSEDTQFINCNIFISGTYNLENTKIFKFNLINSHVSISNDGIDTIVPKLDKRSFWNKWII